MRHASLFSGIGGFEIAAHWMGWENILSVEINPRSRQVLKKHFPNTQQFKNVKTFDGTNFKHSIDILTGGDPCQPHSTAGLRKGKADDRYLWPEMFRIAQELNVPWIVNENVAGSISNGILDIKINDLESIGYSCQAYSIPVEAVGGLHQRERIWLVAYNANFDRDCKESRSLCKTQEREIKRLEAQQYEIHKSWESVNLWDNNAYSDTERFEELDLSTSHERQPEGALRHSRYFGFGSNAHGNITRHAIESGIMGMLDGLPEGMDYADRNKRIAEAGNAVAPQVVYEIFKAIENFKPLEIA